MVDKLQSLPWLPDLLEQVRIRLSELRKSPNDLRPALKQEHQQHKENAIGWSTSLANPNLAASVRSNLEDQWAAALQRTQEIENIISELESQSLQDERLVDEEEVLTRLECLADVLAAHNPTLGNLELSLHIDRIDCSPGGKVVMRTCKLGALTETIDLLSEVAKGNGNTHDSAAKLVTPRRRGRPRLGDADENRGELRTLAEFATDPDRFAGLGDEWFWEDEFQIPARPLSWAAENADAVFQRRQEKRLSYAKLADEFDVTPPTARAAVLHYLAEHREARDEVNLRPGEKKPKIDVTKFGTEARLLRESGWSKSSLAGKFACSEPVINRALAWAYEQDGLPMPTRDEKNAEKISQARKLLEAGHALGEIAKTMGVSTTTARAHLRASFAAEGKEMPDLRRRREAR